MARTHDREDERERYRELLEEHRTVLPGVQVLFAFLLMAPFSARFEKLDDLGRELYTVSLLFTAMAAFAFIAPAAYHRLAESSDRLERLRWSVKLQVTGLTMLAVAMTIAIFVVVRFEFDAGWGAAVAGAAAATALTLWYVVPLTRRRNGDA